MDDKKIIIVNLSKGLVGETNANLLGSMLITKIYLAAMSRADVSQNIHKLPNFYFFVDEFQSFANESFADILSEARKYKLNLTIAHQYIEQMPEEVRAAVFGNVGTMITFRVGAFDAEVLEKEFAPYFEAQDLVNLGFVQIYLKLMIDGISSQPFSARTLPPIEKPIVSFKEQILANSRAVFARPRAEVEAVIKEWHDEGHQPPAAKRGDKVAPKNPTPAPVPNVTAPAVNHVQPIKTEVLPTVNASKPINHAESTHNNHNNGANNSAKILPKSFLKPSDVQAAVAKGDLVPAEHASKPIKKDDSKGPKPENVNALRNALSSVLKDVKAAEDCRKNMTEKIEKKVEEVKTSQAPVQNNHHTQNKLPKEVPEDVLKKVLGVDGE